MKGGSQKIEKFFFAFLDELDHLEAKKKELIKLMENRGKFDPSPPLDGNSIKIFSFFFLHLPLQNQF